MLYSYPSHVSQNNHPLSINLLGMMHNQEPINRPNGLPFFQWFYCESGRGNVIIENRKSILNPGEGILIYPGINHSYNAVDDSWIVSFIGFSGANCLEILRSLRMQESGVYHFNHENPFLRYEKQILEITHLSKSDQRHRLSVICYDFLLTLSENIRFISTSEEVADSGTVRKILEFLEDHYSQTITIDDLARTVHLSRAYTQSLFKAETKTTIMQHLTSIRINHARNLLIRYPERPVYTIASECGFKDASYFGYIFKKQTGITPAQFRK